MTQERTTTTTVFKVLTVIGVAAVTAHPVYAERNSALETIEVILFRRGGL